MFQNVIDAWPRFLQSPPPLQHLVSVESAARVGDRRRTDERLTQRRTLSPRGRRPSSSAEGAPNAARRGLGRAAGGARGGEWAAAACAWRFRLGRSVDEPAATTDEHLDLPFRTDPFDDVLDQGLTIVWTADRKEEPAAAKRNVRDALCHACHCSTALRRRLGRSSRECGRRSAARHGCGAFSASRAHRSAPQHWGMSSGPIADRERWHDKSCERANSRSACERSRASCCGVPVE